MGEVVEDRIYRYESDSCGDDLIGCSVKYLGCAGEDYDGDLEVDTEDRCSGCASCNCIVYKNNGCMDLRKGKGDDPEAYGAMNGEHFPIDYGDVFIILKLPAIRARIDRMVNA